MDKIAHHDAANKRVDIAFLHTGEVHIKTFESITKAIDPTVSTYHRVQQDFLTHAMTHGTDESLEIQIRAVINELALMAKVVVCTCSSIGAIAEKLNGLNGAVVQRIDRAMADKAVKLTANENNHILVAAALESTIEPTLSLINDSAKSLDQTVHVSHCVVPNAWQHFESGDLDKYKKSIAVHLDSLDSHASVIVLAQASMAGCEAYLPTANSILGSTVLGKSVLSSPILGVEAAMLALC